jgi:DNA repair protein RadC
VHNSDFNKDYNSGYLSIDRWPEEDRPREKLLKYGSEHLTNGELLAILLRTGIKTAENKKTALDLAKELLFCFKSLNNIIELSISELASIKGIGIAKAAQIIASFELGRRALSEKSGNNKSFRCSEDIANHYIPLLKDLKKEQFRIVLLNIKNRIIKDVLVSLGSLTSSIVHPREVLKIAIKESAASVIFIHNHPSGDPEPSIDDIEITKRLCKSCNIIGINVLDHIIIGRETFYSFKANNML